MSEQEKPRKTYTVRLTRAELVHLRDLFSVLLPLEMKETLSHRLAHLQDRVMVEAKLWQKVVAACQEANLPLDDDAPDFVVTASAAPPIGVFELSSDAEQQDNLLENAFVAEEDEEDDEEEGSDDLEEDEE